MAATAAHVQAQEANSDDPALLEEVVVYGIQQSLQNAQDIKREAATVKDVITASDIGALPDKSVVEALQRVPGVAIERFEASNDPDHFSVEGGNVTVRGLNRVRSEFNGRDSFSAGGDGGMNFSDIPPEMVGSVEVIKNSTADVTEGGTSGTINLITRKPFDKEEFQAGVTVKGSYGDLIDDISPSFSAIASNVWDTDAGKFGALISVSASNLTTRGDGVGVYNHYEISEGVIAPNAPSARQQFNDRDRLGLAGSLQYANPSETVEATLEFIRSDSTLAWNERFIEFPAQPFSGDAGASHIELGEDARFGCSDPFTVNGDPCQFQSGTIMGDEMLGSSLVSYVTGSRAREDERTINDLSLNLKVTPNDNLTLWGDVQFVDATSSINDMTAHGKFYSDVFLDLRHTDKPGLEFQNNDLADPSQYFARSAMDHISDNEGEETAFQFDAEYTFDDSWVTAVKGGVRFSNKEVTVRESDYNWGVISESWIGSDVSYFDQEDINSGLLEEFTFDNHLAGSAMNTNNTFLFPSLSSLQDTQFFFDTYKENNMYQFADWVGEDDRNPESSSDHWQPLHTRNGVIEGTPFLPTEIYVTEEDRTAAYVRMDFGNEDADLPYSGNFGLRYVSWQLTSTGASNFPDAFDEREQDPNLTPALSPEEIAFSNGASGQIIEVQGEEFSRVLPSLNLKLGVTDDFIVRFAFSEAIYLPNLDKVRNQRNVGRVVTRTEDDSVDPPVTTGISIDAFTVNGAGNPYLQPELATNYDLAFEWYFADLGSLTSTLFYKSVRDYFRQATSVEVMTNPDSGASQPVLITQTINAGTANVQGYELAYQSTFGFLHESAENFGIQASYTFIDGSASHLEGIEQTDDGSDEYKEVNFNNFNGLPLEGLSKHNSNLAIFFDNGTFQTRFAYSWRSDYLLNSRDTIAFSPVYGEATGQLDWSASLNVTDNFKVGLEANNVLNEVTKTSIQYNQDGIKTPRSYFVNDRRIGLYVQATF